MRSHLEILHAVAQHVNRSLDLGEVLRSAVEALTHVTGHEIASLHVLAQDGQSLELKAERGMSPALRRINERLPVGQGLIGGVAATGQMVKLDEVGADPRLLGSATGVVRAEGIMGFVCVPIRSRGRILGTLSLGRRLPEPFEDTDVVLLEAAADQIGLALDNAQLYAELQRRLDELRWAQDQLIQAEKLSAVGQLAAGVAHEINNPLTTILGHVYLLKAKHDLEEPVRERLEIIGQEVARAAQIVRDLLLFARHYTPERRPCLLADQVRRVLTLAEPQLRQEGIEVRTEFSACPPVLADENQIQQVLLNLIQNARQAMAGQAGRRTLTIRVARLDGSARVEVLDTGPGIPQECLPRIFDPFFTTKPPGQGTGLGLSVSHGIVAEHGGRLSGANRPEGGAAFVVELPVSSAA
jgi:signal transduction histidine kinase